MLEYVMESNDYERVEFMAGGQIYDDSDFDSESVTDEG